MNDRNERQFYLLIKVFVALGSVGLVLFVVSNLHSAPEEVVFSLIAFVISVAAVIMTTLQSITISQQIRMTKKASQLVDETAEQVRKLIQEDARIEHEIRQDLEVDREIISVLEEYGVGDNEEERKDVARHLRKTLKNR